MNDNNPTGLDGFEFLEFSGPSKEFLHDQFIKFGFTKTAIHKSKDITLYQQGKTNFLLNNQPNSQASKHASAHGAGACSMGFKVNDAKQAFSHTIKP